MKDTHVQGKNKIFSAPQNKSPTTYMDSLSYNVIRKKLPEDKQMSK